jgi:flagellar hook-basal body complex protein FliE
MPINPITAVQGVTGTGYIEPVRPSTDGTGFGASIASTVTNLQQLQSTSNEMSIKAITGDLNDIHSATIASSRASVTLELVAAVRNKGVDAFTEIMRMQA